jgi:hypothetical protein
MTCKHLPLTNPLPNKEGEVAEVMLVAGITFMFKQRIEVVLNAIGQVPDKLAKPLPYIPMDKSRGLTATSVNMKSAFRVPEYAAT